MADAVTTNTIFSGTKRLVERYTNISDGTGEAAVIKVDKSTLIGPDGTEPAKIVIEKIEYVCDGLQVRVLG